MKNVNILSGFCKPNCQLENRIYFNSANTGFLKENQRTHRFSFKKMLMLTVWMALSAYSFNVSAQCVGNLLQNPSFESPVVPNTNANNIQPGTMITGGWTANATNGFNIIRVNGTNYTQGPNNASDGNQYIDGASANIIITQSFTLTSTATIAYNGRFANREAGNSSYEPWTGTIQIVNASNAVISTSNAVSFTTTTSDENWFLSSGTINSLAPGTYTYRVNLGNYGHFDNASICVTSAPAYIYVHNRTLDELSSVPFSYTGTGGISSFTLNDQPAQVPQNDLGSSANGRLYTTGSLNNTLYYRDLGSATWVATTITNATRVDGGATNTAYFVSPGGAVSFFNGTTATVIGDATDFGGSGAADVGSTWDNRPYVVAGGRLYRYSGSGTTWAQIGTSNNNISVDGNPSNGNIIVCKTDQTVASITAAGVATNLGTPPAINTTIDPADVGVDSDGDIYACFSLLSNNQNTVFKWRGGTTWTEDPTGLGITNVTGGIGGQVWGIGVNGKTVNNGNIFTRSFNGSEILWIDDERVRTSPAAGNSQMIAVAPGTYTITETEPAGWDLVQVIVADPTNNSSSNYTARTATVTVAAGETVNLTFENILLQSQAVTNSCTTTFTENFGTGATGTFGARLVGQTSYHYRNDAANAGDGNYKIVSQATDWATFAQATPIIYDHTSGNGTGRMMAVNASYERGDFFRRRFTGLIVGASYSFSGWFANLTSTSPIDPNITFAVTNPTTQAVIASANTGNISSAGVWEQTSLTFTATTTSVDLILTNNNLGGNGNDLALDDITFRLLPPQGFTATTTNTTCTVTTGSATVTAPVGAAYEYSRDGTTYQSSATFSGLAPGNYTLSARYVGSTNCVVTTTVTVRGAICGNVFNDPNGNAVKDATEPFITNGSVWVNLVNPSTNDVVQSVQLLSDGTYSLTGVLPSTSYSIILSATNQTGNTNLTTATLPTGFVNTGVNLGGTANSGNNTGIITLNSGTANILNQNFAIEQPPTAGSGTNTATNPGGTTQVTVPPNTFTSAGNSTDPTAAPNGITGIRILGIPAGATSIVVNGTTYTTTNVAALTALTIPADANGNPTVAISVDPTATGNTTVTIQFRAVDAAGELSANIGTAVLNTTSLITISGNVFDDPNGNAIKDAAELFIINGSVWANLVNPATDDVIQSVQVSGTGAYSFAGLAQNTAYEIILTTSSQTGNLNLTTATLPAGFVSTGVNLGGTANTTNSTGVIALTTSTADLPNQNFAIEQLPTAGSGANTAANPGGTTQVSVPANTFTNTGNSTDPTAAPNGVTGIRILGIPAGATSIVVNGTTYTSANVGTLTALTIPADANGNPTVAVSVDPTATGNTTVTIQFRAVDAAGELSANTGNAVLTLAGPITVSGTVFDDANGLTDATVNGTGIGVLSGAQLYVHLVSTTSPNTVVAVATVAANGTYTFNNVTPNTSYTVRLSTTQGTVGTTPPAVAVPANWVITGENLGAGAGNDGNDGILGFNAGTANIVNANFGVDARPVGTDKTLAAVANPGGTARVPIPATAFTATDLEDAPGGYANNLNGRTVTLDPNSGTGLIYYNGAQVNIAGQTFTNFNPALVTYDPAANGVTNGVFTYSVLDNAGVASVANTITVQFNDLTISGTVFNDPNTDAIVNGTPANFVGSNTLYAILLNGTTIVSSQAVGANGTTGAYSFGTANGVVAGTSYTVIISNSPTSIAPALTGALNSSETDGTPNGIIAVNNVTANVAGQNFGISAAGYIYVQKKTLDESSSIDFTFTGTGGIGTIVLNDNPTQLGVKDLGATASGRLYAIGNANTNLYYRDLGSSVWVNTTLTGFSRVDGGAASECYLTTTTGNVVFYSGIGTTTTVVGTPANYGASNASDIGNAWDNAPYIVTAAGLLYKYNDTGWARIGTSTNNRAVVGFPTNSGCVVTRTDNLVYRITVTNVETSLGRPAGTTSSPSDVAVDGNGNIYASYPTPGFPTNLLYRWTGGTSWSSPEVTSNVTFVTGGVGGLVWGTNIAFSNTGPYSNIFTRTFDGTNIQWLDDERVRTTINGNTHIKAVVPGTYTITETVPSGWYLKEVAVADPSANSSSNLATASASVTVGAGETVATLFTNVFITTTPVVNDCNSQYLETFGTGARGTFGGPLVGQTSYHHLAEAINTADGYYKIVSWSRDFATFGSGSDNNDHTSTDGTGRFMAVNAAYDRNEFFRRRFTGLIVGATYRFNSWAVNLTNLSIKPNISFIVQNPTTASTVASTSSGDITSFGVWAQYGFSFTATASTLDLSIVNNTIGGNGNDLGLDDISLNLVAPAGPLTTTSANGSCTANGTITVTAPLGSIYEYSINGTTFQASPTFTGVAAGTYVVTARYVGSTNCGLTAAVTLTPSICGNVFNDVNGNAVKEGTEPFITSGLFANLVDPGTNDVIQSVQVQADGTYSFNTLTAGTAYQIILSTTSQTGNLNLTTATLPAGFANTGVNLGGTANTTNQTGVINITATAANLINQSFAVEALPIAGSGSNTATNQPGNAQVTVPANTFTITTPSSDPTPGAVTSIRITAFPTNVTSIRINNITYTSADVAALTALIITTDGNGAPIAPFTISVDPVADNTASVSIPFKARDAAGKESTNTGTAVLNLLPLVSISGNVFNDVNGNAVKEALEVITGGVFANLVDPTTNTVLQSVVVDLLGNYTFANATQNTAYRVILTNNSQAVNATLTASTLPAGFANTGVNLGGTANTGNQTGIINIATVGASLVNQNFGIEALPVAGSGNNIATDPGGTAQVEVPANTFTRTTPSSDPTPGAVTSIRITTFPAGATSIRIGDTTYTTLAALEKRIIPTDVNGNPTVTISVDPLLNNTPSVTIRFVARDAAGKESANTGTAVLNLLTPVSISGNVFNDVNGDAVQNGGEALITNGSVFANLVDPVTNEVIQSVVVSNTGTYTFANASQNTTYNIILTTTSQAVNTTLTTSTLPAGFANTGVNLGGTANTTNQTGIISVTTAAANITALNFGIESIPIAGGGTNSGTNLSGTLQVTVPANTFTNATLSSDATLVTGIRITALPAGVTSIIIGGVTYNSGNVAALTALIIPTDANGIPTVTITVDPSGVGATTVSIPFRARDAAGKESANTGNAVLNLLAPVSISGNVFNDPNGNAVVDGGEPFITDGSVYANLVNAANVVLQSVQLDATGSYSFTNASQNTAYRVVLTNNSQAINSTLLASTLPVGFANTGINVNGVANTTIQTGVISLTTGTANVTAQNFAIEALPFAGSGTFTTTNPGGALLINVPASTFTNGALSTDPTPGAVTGIRITALPAGAASIVINGVTYNSGNLAALTALTIPTDASGNPTFSIAVDPTNAGATTVSIPFRAVDAAGKLSVNTGNAVITLLAPVTITGNVFNDANGNAVVDGVDIFITDGTVFANLVDPSTNAVIQSVAVDASGNFTFGTVSQNTNYNIILSSSNQTGNTNLVTSTLPAGFVNTGVNVNGTAIIANQTGVINLTTGTVNVTNIGFGIDALPVAGSGVFATTNLGGTTQLTLPASAFTSTQVSTDPVPGTVTGIRITAFPAGAASIVIGGITYLPADSAALKALIISTDGNGNPTPIITVDPAIDGATSVTISFVARDAAGKESANTGTATLNLNAPVTISGSIFVDANGNAIIDGTETFVTNGSVYANLVNPATGAVLQSVQVDASGNYAFTGTTQNTSYRIILSTISQTGNTNLTTSSLPAGFVSTGVNLGGVANTGNQTGIITVTTGVANLTAQNFGIERPPVTANYTAAGLSNPGGTGTILVPVLAFTGTDAEDGTYATGLSGRTVSLTPGTGGTLSYNGVPVTATTIFPNFNPAQVRFDPAANGATTGTFSYNVFDNANKPSVTAATVTLQFSDLLISGIVFNDPNADGIVNGTPAGTIGSNVLFALLTDGTNIIASQAVTAGGTYSFNNASGVIAGNSYSVVLSTSATVIAPALTGAVYNSETDGSADGTIAITNITASVTGQNFGINRLPTAISVTAVSVSNPGGTIAVSVPATVFTGTDPEDGTYPANLAGRTVAIGAGVNGTLFYNGVQVQAGGIIITGFDPALLSFDPLANGTTTGSFSFNVYDDAGKPAATPAIVTLPFDDLLITGIVFNDGNATPLVDGTPAGVIGSNTLYAVLLDSAGNVVARVAVAPATGVYSFGTANGVVAGFSYTIVVTNDSTITVPTLVGAVYNSETDGTVDGAITVTVVTGNVTGQNFGIDQLPVVISSTAISVANPGGTNTVAIPVASFNGTDAEDGTYTPGLNGRRVLLSPGVDGNLYYNGVLVTTDTLIVSFDAALVGFDPNTGVATGSFNYLVYDNADKPAPAPATITLQFSDLTISGTVFNDPNTTAAVDGTPTGIIGSNVLYVVLLNSTGNVVARKPVDPVTGTYSFGTADGVTSGSSYTIVLVNGSTATTPGLDAGTIYNSESDGFANGIDTVLNVTANRPDRNFGINQLPVVIAATMPLQLNPGATGTIPVPATLFAGSDPEDGPYTPNLTGRTVNLASGTNGSVYYNGTIVPTGAGTTIPNFNPALVTFDPADGTVTSTFTYNVFDDANKASATPATVTIPFRLGVTIAGNIWNDVNGNANIDLTEVLLTVPATMYANIVDTFGVVRQSVPVVNGAYTSGPVFTDSVYNIILTNAVQTPGTLLTVSDIPGGWISTGVNPGATTGTANTTNRSGILPVSTAGITTGMVNRNFGIEQIPVANNGTALTQANFAPYTQSVVATSFSGNDFSGGTIQFIRITAFPTNAQTIVIGGVTYTSATFPTGGVTVAALPNGNPVPAISVKPNAGATTVVIPYVTVDNAGAESAGATVTVPYYVILPVTGLDLIAVRNGNDVVLKWTTLTEQNTSHFLVERSYNGSSFETIGTLQASANSNALKAYATIDRNVVKDLVYYRITLLDKDGKKTVSNMVTVRLSGFVKNHRVFPNPVRDMINVELSKAGRYNITLYNGAGQQIATRLVDAGSSMITNLSRNYLPAGSYILKVQDAKTKESEIFKLILE